MLGILDRPNRVSYDFLWGPPLDRKHGQGVGKDSKKDPKKEQIKNIFVVWQRTKEWSRCAPRKFPEIGPRCGV